MKKSNEKKNEKRILGRLLAKELSSEELQQVAGGAAGADRRRLSSSICSCDV